MEELCSDILAPFPPFQSEASSRIPGSERKHPSEKSWLCLSARLPEIPAAVRSW